MANMDEFTSNDAVRRQLLIRLRQLRSAGIDWLPQGAPLEFAPVQSPAPPAIAQESTVFDLPADVGALESTLPLEERRLALSTLADEVKACTRCAELCSTRTQTVFGDGAPGVEVCFVGEAPGADEDA